MLLIGSTLSERLSFPALRALLVKARIVKFSFQVSDYKAYLHREIKHQRSIRMKCFELSEWKYFKTEQVKVFDINFLLQLFISLNCLRCLRCLQFIGIFLWCRFWWFAAEDSLRSLYKSDVQSMTLIICRETWKANIIKQEHAFANAQAWNTTWSDSQIWIITRDCFAGDESLVCLAF